MGSLLEKINVDSFFEAAIKIGGTMGILSIIIICFVAIFAIWSVR